MLYFETKKSDESDTYQQKEDTSLSQVNVNHCHSFEPQATQKVLVMKVDAQVTLGQIHVTCPDDGKNKILAKTTIKIIKKSNAALLLIIIYLLARQREWSSNVTIKFLNLDKVKSLCIAEGIMCYSFANRGMEDSELYRWVSETQMKCFFYCQDSIL